MHLVETIINFFQNLMIFPTQIFLRTELKYETSNDLGRVQLISRFASGRIVPKKNNMQNFGTVPFFWYFLDLGRRRRRFFALF